MSEKIQFFTNPRSRGRIVRWMLEEVGADYDVHVLEYGDEMQANTYRAINPMRKVPAIQHHDVVVTECAAICAYLADAFPGAKLAPPTGERGAYYRWLFFAAGPLESAIINTALGVELQPEQQGFVGYGDLGRVLDTLEAAVSKTPYITGDKFTAADVYVGSQINYGLQFGTIDKRDAFKDYAKRVADREAWRKADELDNALMPEGAES